MSGNSVVWKSCKFRGRFPKCTEGIGVRSSDRGQAASCHCSKPIDARESIVLVQDHEHQQFTGC